MLLVFLFRRRFFPSFSLFKFSLLSTLSSRALSIFFHWSPLSWSFWPLISPQRLFPFRVEPHPRQHAQLVRLLPTFHLFSLLPPSLKIPPLFPCGHFTFFKTLLRHVVPKILPNLFQSLPFPFLSPQGFFCLYLPLPSCCFF